MNVQQFIDHRTKCPCCNNDVLTLSFNANNKQILNRNGSKLIVIFNLDGIKKGQKKYKAGFSIDKDNNEFHVDFYDYSSIDETYENASPLYLLERFKYFNDKQQEYKLYKNCLICNNYSYQSQYFKMNLKRPIIEDLNIEYEAFSFYHLYNGKKYSIRLLGEYLKSSSFYIQSISERWSKEFTKMDMPYINFTTPQEVGDRLLKLITFS